MKVLIVNFSDTSGGAARAAYRLHDSLISIGVKSEMLVSQKSGDNYLVHSPETNKEKLLAKLSAVFNIFPIRKYNRKAPFSPSFLRNLNVVKKINQLKPDIVHLHWINAGMLRVEDLKKINAPIVWSLHDMWSFTGGCHYSGNCEAYILACKACPVLESKKIKDVSWRLFKRKEVEYKKLNDLTIVGLSKWLANCAKSSKLFKDKRVVNIPNPIDTSLFKPIGKRESRGIWNLPLDKKLILFGAMSATSDERKGFKELLEALKLIKSEGIELIIFGSSRPKKEQDFGFKTHYLGQLHDQTSLITLFNSVDVMVTPSLQENLSNVIMESLSCGTPVVGFNIGGNSDLVDHCKNGYLAELGNVQDLANGITWVLNNESLNIIRANAREKAILSFDKVKVANRYLDLYSSILKSQK